jgi:hypothetical protein
MITETICNYQVIEEATKLKGKEVNLTIEGIAKVFKMPSTGTILGRKEGYRYHNQVFCKRKRRALHSSFWVLICKTNGPWKVMKLEALIENLTFR